MGLILMAIRITILIRIREFLTGYKIVLSHFYSLDGSTSLGEVLCSPSLLLTFSNYMITSLVKGA